MQVIFIFSDKEAATKAVGVAKVVRELYHDHIKVEIVGTSVVITTIEDEVDHGSRPGKDGVPF